MKKLLMAIAILLSINAFSFNGYVTKTGNNANTGTTESLAWRTISYAVGVRNWTSGDTLFVKSGDYGNEQVIITKSGSKTNPFVIKGYKLNKNEFIFPIVDMNADYSTFTGFNVNTMPTLTGINRGSGIGFKLDGVSGVTIMNFQVTNYQVGFSAGTVGAINNNYITFQNCNVYKTGNQSSVYSGKGIQLGDFQENKYCKNSKVTGCLILNCAAEGIEVSGDSNQVWSSRVYCSEDVVNSATNYYMPIFGKGNLIQSCRVTRIKGLSHIGYGIVIRSSIVDNSNTSTVAFTTSTNNTVNYCTADNLGECFVVKHIDTKYNYFYKCQVYGSNTWNTRDMEENTAIVFKDGATNNIFEALSANNVTNGVDYAYSIWYNLTSVNSQNSVQNCDINDAWIAVNFAYSSSANATLDVGNNKMLNNTFRNARNLFLCDRSCGNMFFVNNIFLGAGGYFTNGSYYSTNYAYNFNYCDVYGVVLPGGFIAGGNHCISVDPLFLSTNDDHLQTSSPCKTSGLFNTVTRDYDNVVRTNPTSMGCFK